MANHPPKGVKPPQFKDINRKIGFHLTFKHELAATLQAIGTPQEEIAKRLNYVPSTIYGWNKQPLYVALVLEKERFCRKKLEEFQVDELAALYKIIKRGSDDPKVKAADAVRAAEIILKTKGLLMPTDDEAKEQGGLIILPPRDENDGKETPKKAVMYLNQESKKESDAKPAG